MPFIPLGVAIMRFLPFVTTLFGMAILPTLALAQTLTDEELLAQFQKQRDAFKAAQESGTGQTRGLTLVTVENVDVQTEVAGQVAPDAGDGTATVASSGDGSVTTTTPTSLDAPGQDVAVVSTDAPAQPVADAVAEGVVTPVVFGKLAPEMQVNAHITFAYDSASLAEDQKPQLAQLCKVMNLSDINLFRIVGHTDSAGSDEYNEKLSLLRAREVQRYFITECGIAPERLEAIGLGERFLSNETEPKSGDNRRVEFQALS
jgi:OmpA-OmpF porin, OOP family